METWEEEADNILEEIENNKKVFVRDFYVFFRTELRNRGLKQSDINKLVKSIRLYVNYKIEEVKNR